MKNYFLMSILLVVACVCASCEPNSEEPINYQEGEVSQVELSIEDKETLDQIFQYVESTKADDLLHEAGARCIPFIVRSKKDLQQLAPKGVQVPNLDLEKYSLVWCVYESPYLEAKVTIQVPFLKAVNDLATSSYDNTLGFDNVILISSLSSASFAPFFVVII